MIDYFAAPADPEALKTSATGPTGKAATER